MLSKTLAAAFAIAVHAQSIEPVTDPTVNPSDVAVEAPLFPEEYWIPVDGNSPLPMNSEFYDCFSGDLAYKIAGIDSISYNVSTETNEGSVAIQYWNKYIDESTISDISLYMDTPESTVKFTLPFSLIMFKVNEMKDKIEEALHYLDGNHVDPNPIFTTLAPFIGTTPPVSANAVVPQDSLLSIFPMQATDGSVIFSKTFTLPAQTVSNEAGDYSSSPLYPGYNAGAGAQGIIAGEYSFAAQGFDVNGNELFCFHAYGEIPSVDGEDQPTVTDVAPEPTTTKFLR